MAPAENKKSGLSSDRPQGNGSLPDFRKRSLPTGFPVILFMATGLSRERLPGSLQALPPVPYRLVSLAAEFGSDQAVWLVEPTGSNPD
jgi:hypothetical protein